jgi:membrane protease YdiL (CAAX protease family)
MQLSGIIGIPVVAALGIYVFHESKAQMAHIAIPSWIVISFIAALIIILPLYKKSLRNQEERISPMPIGQSLLWAVGGIFMAFAAQYAGAIIEHLIGVNSASENTDRILALIESLPLVVIVSSIVGPILEEIVFRKIIFGSLYKKFSFNISATISSLLFALAHQDITHLIVYTLMGFTFAYLYRKTGRIIVSTIAHVVMNTVVVLIQLSLTGQMHDQIKSVQGIIGGFFS